MTNVGELDTLITVQQCVISQGNDGEKTRTWTNYRDVYAKVETNVDESQTDYNLTSGRSLRITIWKLFDKAKNQLSWRVLVDGAPYEVTSTEMLDKMFQVLTARAIKG